MYLRVGSCLLKAIPMPTPTMPPIINPTHPKQTFCLVPETTKFKLLALQQKNQQSHCFPSVLIKLSYTVLGKRWALSFSSPISVTQKNQKSCRFSLSCMYLGLCSACVMNDVVCCEYCCRIFLPSEAARFNCTLKMGQ